MYNLQQSLPRNPGAINIQPRMDRKLYDQDPKFDIFKKSLPSPYLKHIVIGNHRPKTTDTFNIARQSELRPMTLPPDTGIGVYSRKWIQPLPIARFVQEPPTNGLTNAQVNILNSVDDPTRKYFLLEMFKGKIQITTNIKGKLAGITPADATILDQSLNSLLQKYTGLSNMNKLTDAELKKILDEYYFEIKPIYEKWKIANPTATFDPIQELTTGLITMLPTSAPIPPIAPASSSAIGSIVPSTPAVVPAIGAPAPGAPSGAPSGAPPSGAPPLGAPSGAPVPSASDILIQDALDILVKIGDAESRGDVKDKDMYFGQLHKNIITMTPAELTEFDMLSSGVLKSQVFATDYREYLVDNSMMTTSDIRDMYGSTLSPGAVNILDPYVPALATPTPATPTTSGIPANVQNAIIEYKELGMAMKAKDGKKALNDMRALYNSLINMSSPELTSFDNNSNNSLTKNKSFMKIFVDYLTNGKKTITPEIRDLHGTTLTPGQANPLDPFVPPSSATPVSSPVTPASTKLKVDAKELDKLIFKNKNINKKDLIDIAKLIYSVPGTDDEKNDFPGVMAGSIVSIFQLKGKKPDVYKRIISEPKSALYKALMHYAYIYNENINNNSTPDFSKKTALTSILTNKLTGGLGKKKGKKTAMPKQYKAGGKQRTARQKQLARLIKLL